MTALCQEISLGGAQQQLQNDREHVRSLQTVKPHVAEFLVKPIDDRAPSGFSYGSVDAHEQRDKVLCQSSNESFLCREIVMECCNIHPCTVRDRTGAQSFEPF
jgi:hypothetical protein